MLDECDRTLSSQQKRRGRSSEEYGVPAECYVDSEQPIVCHRNERRLHIPKKKYDNYDKRLKSFRNWPHQHMQKKTELAKAGFFYTGVGDGVQCFCCEVHLRRWTSGTDPLLQHIIHSTTCVFALEQLRARGITDQMRQLHEGARVNDIVINTSGNPQGSEPTQAQGQMPSGAWSTHVNRDQTQIKHRKYLKWSMREVSFKKWPYEHIHPSNSLVDAGFFYKGVGDCISCFHCGCEAPSLVQYADIRVVHLRLNPNCEYLKSQRFRETSPERLAQNGRDNLLEYE